MAHKSIAAVVIIAATVFGLWCVHWDSAPLNTRVIIAGSSCMGRMLDALAEGYNTNKGGWVQAQLGGTELGLLGLEQGVCDIASCSRTLTEEEKLRFDYRAVALDAIAVAVHPTNDITEISAAELHDIYAGIITDWAQLGQRTGPIVVVGREAASGTRSAFESAIGLNAPATHSQEHSETGMLRTAIATAPGAIGYLSFDYIDDTVRQVPVNGVTPNEATIRLGRYPITREFLLCTRKGETRTQVLAFLAYAESDEGRNIIRSLNMLPAQAKGKASP